MLNSSKKLLVGWLRLASIVTIFTGVIAALASHPLGSSLWLKLFDILKWPMNNDPAAFSDESYAINAVLGGTMIGWGVMMLGLLKDGIFQERLRSLFIRSLLAWFICDSLGSFAAGLPGNVLMNLAFLAMFLPPLVMVKKYC